MKKVVYNRKHVYLSAPIVKQAYRIAKLTGICSVYYRDGLLTYDGSLEVPDKATVALQIVRARE